MKRVVVFLAGFFSCAILFIGYLVLHNDNEQSEQHNPGPGVTVVTPPSTIAPTPARTPTSYPGTTSSCDLIDGYKYGITFDSFKEHYAKKFTDSPVCHPMKSGGKDLCDGCVNCEGNMVIGDVPANVTFGFSDGKLADLGGNFSPDRFGEVKGIFMNTFGKPTTDVPELVYWYNGGLPVFLNQVPNEISGQRFNTWSPPNDLATEKHSACLL
jgi:hypothetical protein